jgi:hypothetical protein
MYMTFSQQSRHVAGGFRLGSIQAGGVGRQSHTNSDVGEEGQAGARIEGAGLQHICIRIRIRRLLSHSVSGVLSVRTRDISSFPSVRLMEVRNSVSVKNMSVSLPASGLT